MSNANCFFMPNCSLFGAGSLEDIGEQARRLGGQNYLMVTDSFLASSGVTCRIAGLLKAQGIETSLYDQVVPNPTVEGVEEAFGQFRRDGCAGVISIGGGSAHDCGKAVCVLAANGGPLTQYVGCGNIPNRAAPLIAVNTTAGTASEMTNCFIITDTKSKTKLIFEDANALAAVAINDPQLTLTLPGPLTAATGMDALTHAVECYVSSMTFTLTDSLAVEAVRSIFRWLPQAVECPDSLQAREGMAYAQFMAGMAFGNGGVGLVHAIAHQLGGV